MHVTDVIVPQPVRHDDPWELFLQPKQLAGVVVAVRHSNGDVHGREIRLG
jgi:hypothetical protein